MKTLLFTLEYPPFRGGIANYYENLVKYWPGQISILHNNEKELINPGLPVLKWLPAVFKLRRAIKKEVIDHVLIGQILPLGTAAYLISLISKIEYSVFLHGMDLGLALKQPRKRRLAKIILNRADKIICNSSYVAKLAEGFVGKNDKIKVVNPGAENRITHNLERVTQLKEKYNLQNKLVLLTVGRLVKRKGVDKVLESLPEVIEQIPNLIYIIVGNGPETSSFKFQVSSFRLENHAIIIEDASDEERNAWYDLCDIFIMPARQIEGDVEGFGIVYLEAGLHGKPVIAGDSGGVRDAVVDNLNGLLVNPESGSEIAAAIVKLARDEALRKRLGEQGRERALKNFDWKKQVERIYKIISNNNKRFPEASPGYQPPLPP